MANVRGELYCILPHKLFSGHWNSSKLSNNTDSIFGYKHFIKPNDKFKGYDRGLYEKLKNDNAKRWFACHCRELELGEFKNGELDGYGARYSSDIFGYETDDDVYDDLINQAGLNVLLLNFSFQKIQNL